MVVCVEYLPADTPWDVNVVSATRQSSGVAPQACARAYTRVCWCRPRLAYIHTINVHVKQINVHVNEMPINSTNRRNRQTTQALG